ncbi:MAG: DNA polymerase, partial [Candidatus Saccharimonadales bacterium]
WVDAPVDLEWDEADVNDTNLTKVTEILQRLEFASLIRRLPKHMQQVEDKSLYFAPSKEVTVREVAWPEHLTINRQVVIHVDEDDIYLSLDRHTVAKAPIVSLDSSIWRALEFATLVSYDTKQLYHTLATHGIKVRFTNVHDIRQAAFLIDPLRRDRSLAALIGGELEHAVDTVAALWQVYDWQTESLANLPRVKDIAERFDFPLVYHLFAMEHRGIKIDKSLFAMMSEELGAQYAKIEQKMYAAVGYEFNIASPTQLSEVLFMKLQLPTTGIKKGKTGYSTGQKELDKLHGQHPIIELIEQARELAKLKNTYVDTLPLVTDEHDRIHTTFNQDVAATGRLSSTDPNLQNIPIRSELGRKIREAFVPEKGNVFVSADYSQFELRLVAVLAGDTQLIEDFNSDIDVHAKTASDVYGIPLELVTKNQRRDAKVINFGVLYGMSPHGLAAQTGMNFIEAQKFIDQYFEIRKPIREYIDTTLEKARTEGYVETYFGRRRPTPDVNSSNFIVREGAKRAAANMPIQGTEADLMKLAMIAVDEKIDGLGEQILQIHDSILIECPEENAEKIAAVIKEIMEAVAPDLGIKLKVDVGIGSNWGEV